MTTLMVPESKVVSTTMPHLRAPGEIGSAREREREKEGDSDLSPPNSSPACLRARPTGTTAPRQTTTTAAAPPTTTGTCCTACCHSGSGCVCGARVFSSLVYRCWVSSRPAPRVAPNIASTAPTTVTTTAAVTTTTTVAVTTAAATTGECGVLYPTTQPASPCS